MWIKLDIQDANVRLPRARARTHIHTHIREVRVCTVRVQEAAKRWVIYKAVAALKSEVVGNDVIQVCRLSHTHTHTHTHGNRSSRRQATDRDNSYPSDTLLNTFQASDI